MAKMKTAPKAKPDLRKMIEELARWAHSKGLMTAQDVARLRDARNSLLVGARVFMSILKRNGMTDEEAKEITARCVPNAATQSAFVKTGADEREYVTREVGALEALWLMDAAIAGRRVPEWYVLKIWPSICRRVASGGTPTDREVGVILQLLGD